MGGSMVRLGGGGESTPRHSLNTSVAVLLQGRITRADAESPPFDLVVVHKERALFKDKVGREGYSSEKKDCALHLNYRYVRRNFALFCILKGTICPESYL